MLETMREGSQGIIAKVILGFIIVTFALAGIGGYLGGSSEIPAATVNGEEILKSDFDQAYQTERGRMESQFGQMFSQLAADDNYMKNFRDGVLDKLINDELQSQLADEVGLRISNSKIKDIIRTMPEFQVDGKFDNDRYRALLRQAGYQTNTFRDYLREETTRRQLAQAIATTDFSLSSEVKAHSELDKQTRDIEYVVFKQADYTAKVQISDEERASYYEDNKPAFATQEKVSLQYVELKIEDLMKGIAVSDEQMQTYYNDNVTSYRTSAERRRASHILFEFGDDEDAAKIRAQSVLTSVNDGDFVALAKEHSDDTFSAENGGDLDWFERGVMGDEFDEAAFTLAKVDDVSALVRSDSGFHIIKLTGNEPEVIKTFDQVKIEVAQTIKRNQATDTFIEKQETLSTLSFEIPDTLQDAAGGINSEVKESVLFSRSTAPAPLNNAKVLGAAFSELVLVEELNSEVIEINGDHIIVVRLLKHEASRTKSMEEVNSQIINALTKDKASEMAKQAGEALQGQISKTGKLAADDNAKDLDVKAKVAMERFSSDVDSSIRSNVFKLPHPIEGQLSTDVVQMSNGDYALVAVSSVTTGKVPEDTKATEQQLASMHSQRSYKDFIGALKANATIVKLSLADAK
jgi:peptidyl-prolyl cis-trans isomerase D